MSEVITFTGVTHKVYNTSSQWKHITVSMDKPVEYSGKTEDSTFTYKAGNKNTKYLEHVYGEYLPVIEGLSVTVTCEVNKRNGKTFLNCTNWVYAKPNNDATVKAFLKSTLGKEKVLSTRKIVEMVVQYGQDCLEYLKSGNTVALFPFFCSKGATPEAMEKMERACEIIKSNFDNNDFMIEMSKIGVSPITTRKIMDSAEIFSMEELKQNPYICMDVPGISFRQCDQIAASIGAAMDTPERIVACTEATLNAILNRNSNLYANTLLIRDETLKQLNNKDITKEMWLSAIQNNLKSKKPKFFALTSGGNSTIMLAKDADNELHTTQKIRTIQNNKKGKFDASLIRKIATKLNNEGEKTRGFKLTDEQIAAIVTSLSNKVSIITGGPGTGKTTITQMIIQIWKKLDGRPVTCMAPTGKAATRMKEQTGENAQTIHKTVRIIPDEEVENLEKVTSGLIIIDESSMIDMETMTKMIECIPESATVIFLGDVDQLPSVGKGDVLHQMIISNAVALSKLTATKRQASGSPIIENAKRINTGDSNLLYDNDLFEFVKATDSDTKKLTDLYLEKVKEYGVSQVAILCPLRKPTKYNYKMCSDNLNRIIRDCINPETADKNSLEVRQGDTKIKFRVGDRVMSWKNKDDIANGDIGVITKIEEDEFHEWNTSIQWENGLETVLSRTDMENISLAYSMSIHKSQGSEYKCVILPMMSEHMSCQIHSRNLLYTGVTRAKKECIIFGDGNAVKKAIGRVTTTKRTSYLGARLASAAQHA